MSPLALARRWTRLACATGSKGHAVVARTLIAALRTEADLLEGALRSVPEGGRGMRIISFRDTTCATCANPIALGESAVYAFRRTLVCVACADGSEERAA